MEGDAEFAATVGIDAGGDSCRLCVAKSGSDRVNLHVNRVSNRQTPAIIAFDKRLRIYGEEAEARAASLFKNSIPLPLYISGLDKASLGEYIKTKKYLFGSTFDESSGTFGVTFDDSPYQVYPAEVFSFFIDKVLDTVRKEVSCPDGNNKLRIALGVPVFLSDECKTRICNALSLMDPGSILLVKESECLLRRWCDSHLPEVFADFTGKTQKSTMKVAFLDVGFVHSTFFVAEISESDGKFEQKIISEGASDEIGTYQIIEAIGDHICELTGEKIKIPSRQSFYIFKSSTKVLKELSVLSDVKVDVERVLADDEDFTTTISRTKLEELTAHIQKKLQCLIESLLPETLDDLLGMEILGGGSRIPFVKAVAEGALRDRGFTRPLRTSMDTTSAVAYGATKVALSDSADAFLKPVVPEDYHQFLQRESLLRTVEEGEFKKQSLLNEIDNYIIRTKNDAQDYKDVMELEKVEPLLYDLENFANTAIMDKSIDWHLCDQKLAECRAKVEETFPEYTKLKAEKEEQERREREERVQGDVSSMRDVNMDVTLPNSVCIKRANKNKEEGNVLVSAGNVELAAQHYIRAIQYCSKVNNATEEELVTLSDLKLATNLNLAMCYLKMETKTSLNKVVSCCSVALDIRPDHPKALFRRALAYEKLNELEKAIGDAEFGLTAHPDNSDLKNVRMMHEWRRKEPLNFRRIDSQDGTLTPVEWRVQSHRLSLVGLKATVMRAYGSPDCSRNDYISKE